MYAESYSDAPPADSENDVLEHAKKGGFPANAIARVRAVIDPATAE